MSLLKELHKMSSETSTKKRINDLIHFNARMHKKGKFSSDDVAKIMQMVRDTDDDGITKGLSDEALKNLIKLAHVPTLESVEDDQADLATDFEKHYKKAAKEDKKKADAIKKQFDAVNKEFQNAYTSDDEDDEDFKERADGYFESMRELIADLKDVYGFYDEERVNEADENTDDVEEPRMIAKAGDYRVMLLPNEQIVLRRGGDKMFTDLAQMPLVIWKQLARQ